MSDTTPKRRFELELSVSGDEWADVLSEMQRLAVHIEDHGPKCDQASGGYSSGSYVRITERPKTHDQFVEELEAYLAKRKVSEGGEAGNETGSAEPSPTQERLAAGAGYAPQPGNGRPAVNVAKPESGPGGSPASGTPPSDFLSLDVSAELLATLDDLVKVPKDRRSEVLRKAVAMMETAAAAIVPDPLHPDGRCTCAGEARCRWCHSHCLMCGSTVEGQFAFVQCLTCTDTNGGR